MTWRRPLSRFLLATPLAACKPTVASEPPAPVEQVRASDSAPPPDQRELAHAPASGSPDGDGDGVVDATDECPIDFGNQPNGCWIPDTDGDGIFDPQDRCPTAPEVRNGIDDADGCPDECPADLAPILGVRRPLEFRTDAPTLTATAKRELRRLAAIMQRYPAVCFEVSAHVPRVRPGVPPDIREAYNVAVTTRQAAAVVDELVRLGVARERLAARGEGTNEPFSHYGRSRWDRRVELAILVTCPPS